MVGRLLLWAVLALAMLPMGSTTSPRPLEPGAQVVDLQATDITETSAVLHWRKEINGTCDSSYLGFSIDRVPNYDGSWLGQTIRDANQTYALENLTRGATYDVSLHYAGCLGGGAAIQFTTLGEMSGDPGTPSVANLHVTNVTASSATLAWEKEGGTCDAQLWLSKEQIPSNATVRTGHLIPDINHTWVLQNLTPGTTYRATLSYGSCGLFGGESSVEFTTRKVDASAPLGWLAAAAALFVAVILQRR